MPLSRATRRPWPGPIGGLRTFASFLSPATVYGTPTTGAITADLIHYFPFNYLGMSINRVGIEITTGVAGTIYFAIYANDDGVPGERILDGGSLSTASASGGGAPSASSSTTEIVLPDWCWVAYLTASTATFRAHTGAIHNILGTAAGGVTRKGISATMTAAALPSTPVAPTGFLTGSTHATPYVWKV